MEANLKKLPAASSHICTIVAHFGLKFIITIWVNMRKNLVDSNIKYFDVRRTLTVLHSNYEWVHSTGVGL